MSQSIGSISLDLITNTAGFQRQLNNINNAGTGIFRGLQSSFSRFENSVQNSSMFTGQIRAIYDYGIKVRQTKAEIAQLTAVLQQLKSQPVTNPAIEKLKSQISETNAEIQKTKDYISNLNTQNVENAKIIKLKNQISETEANVKKLKDAMLSLETGGRDTQALKGYLESIKKAKAKLQELNDKQSQLAQGSEEWTKIERSIKRVSKEIAKYQNLKESAMHTQGSDNIQKYADLRNQVKALTNNLINYQGKLKAAQNTQLQINTDNAQRNLNRMNSNIENLRQRLKESQNSQLQIDTNNAQRNLNRMNGNIESLRQRLKNAVQVETSNRNNAITQTEQSIASANRRLSEYNRQLLQTHSSSKTYNNGVNSMTASVNKFASAVGKAFSVAAIVNFGKSCVQTASHITNAVTGLKSIVDGQGRSFKAADGFIQEYISDGLVPLQNAVTTYKNLASRGYSDEQIQNVMNALKNSATYGRQASLTLGYAVQSASEGLKNENSILVDNAGVTKNVSVMWKEYARVLGKSYTELTREEKIQAEVNGILEETKFQMGDAEKASNTYTGKVAKLSVAFTNLKSAIGNSIIPVLEKIIPTVQAVITKLTEMFEKISAVSKELFGSKTEVSMDTKQVSNVSSAFDNATEQSDALGESAEETGEKIKKSLMGFDEINQLSDNEQSSENTDTGDSSSDTDYGISGAAAAPDDEMTEAENKAAEFAGKIKTALQPVFTAFDNLKTALQPLKEFAFQGLVDFYEHFLKPVGEWTLGEGLPRFIQAISDGLGKINFENINQKLIELWDALTPFAINIGEGLLWFWEQVLTPLGTWVMNDAVPAFLGLLSSAIRVANSVIKALKPLGEWLWNKFLKPIAEWTGGAVISVIKGLTSALSGISDWIDKHQTAFETLVIVIGSVAAAIGLVSGAMAVCNAALTAYTVVAGIAAGVTAVLTSPITLVVAAIAALIAGIVLIAKNYDVLKEKFSGWFNFWEGFGEVFFEIADTFCQLGKYIIDGIVNGLKSAAESVVEFFSGIIQKIKDVLGIHSPSTVFFDIAVFLMQGLLNGLSEWFGKVVDFFNGLKDSIKEKFEAAVTGIKGIFSGIADWFNTTVVTPIKNFFGGLWDGIKTGASTLGTFISDRVITPIVDSFKSFYNSVVGIMEGVVNGFIGIINNFIDGINNVTDTINEIPGIEIGSIGKLDTVSIPRLASGGIVNQPTLAMVGEYSGANTNPEVIAPLDKLESILSGRGSQNTEKLLTDILTVLKALQMYVNVQIGDEIIERTVLSAIDRNTAMNGGF